MKNAIEYLKYQLDRLDTQKKQLETRISSLDKEKDDALAEFKEVGLKLIDVKAAIKRLEEK